nr:MAG TPA: hypothetical protein [Bacteriophage sp.]
MLLNLKIALALPTPRRCNLYSEEYKSQTRHIIPFGVAFVERQMLFLYPFFI